MLPLFMQLHTLKSEVFFFQVLAWKKTVTASSFFLLFFFLSLAARDCLLTLKSVWEGYNKFMQLLWSCKAEVRDQLRTGERSTI